MDGVGGWVVAPKNDCSRFCFTIASLRALYACPRLALQGLQEGTMLFMSAVPSGLRSCSMMWSASVAMPPHQWQAGLPASSWALAALYAGSDVLRGMVGFTFVCVVLLTALFDVVGLLHNALGLRTSVRQSSGLSSPVQLCVFRAIRML